MKLNKLTFLIILLVFVLLLLIIPTISQLSMMTIVYLISAFQSFFLFICFLISLILIFITRKQRKLLLLAILIATLSVGSSIYTANSSKTVAIEDLPASSVEEIRILSWNTDGVVKKEDIIELALKTKPDIIVLPEEMQPSFFTSFDPTHVSSDGFRLNLYEIGEALDMKIYYWNQASGQTIFISNRLGDYIPINDDTPAFAGFYVEPLDKKSENPNIVVVHLQRPEFGIGTSWWQKHFNWLTSMSEDPNIILIGDFNATLANMGSDTIGKTQNITTLLDIKPVGTWPTLLPAFLGAAIDHIYLGENYMPIWFGVLNQSFGSGHRPIFAIIKKVK